MLASRYAHSSIFNPGSENFLILVDRNWGLSVPGGGEGELNNSRGG